MSFKELPDLLAIGLLIYAFITVARPSGTPVTRLWLAGWICIEGHFLAASFADLPGIGGYVASVVDVAALTWCALCFAWSMDARRCDRDSPILFGAQAVVYTSYVAIVCLDDPPRTLLFVAAGLFAVVPVAILLALPRAQRSRGRWLWAGLNTVLAGVLVACLLTPRGAELLFVAPLSLVYVGCCVQFCLSQQRGTGGFVITSLGLLAWSMVFPLGWLFGAFLPAVHVDAEVWNLPKYLVAVGMILLLLEEQLRQNRHLAQHDALTGLPNRRLFEDRLAGAMARARRDRGQMALLAIDLDGFKAVNDTLGHQVGDRVLQEVASLFAHGVRGVDTIARTGGDEFCVVLESPIDRADAARIAAALAARLQAPLMVDSRRVAIGASVGLAMFPADAPELGPLVDLADRRMYEAKNTGGARVCAA